MEELMDITIQFHNKEFRQYFFPGEEVSCEATIRVLKDSKIRQLGYKLIKEGRGAMIKQSYIMRSGVLLEERALVEGEMIKIPFSFNCEECMTYKGINASLLARLELYMIPAESEKETNLLSKLNFLKLGKKKKNSMHLYVPYRFEGTNYEVLDAEKYIGTKFVFPAFLSIVIVASLFAIIFSKGVWLIGFLVISGLTVLGSLVYFAMRRAIAGNIHLSAYNVDAHNLEFQIRDGRSWSYVKKISFNYGIYEEVEDHRGTSPVKYTETLYESKTIELNTPDDIIKQAFPFPKDKPESMRFWDARIYWYFEMKIYSIFGLVFTVGGELEVKRKVGEEEFS